MYRQKRDPVLLAKALDDQKRLIVCISKIAAENEENVAEVAALLEEGVDASAKDYNLTLYYASKNYFSPLHYAARKGAIRILELLLKYHADPNAKDRYEVSPLHLAAENGSMQCVKRLLEAGSNVNAKTRYLKDYHHRNVTENSLTQPVLALHKSVRLPYTGGTTPLHLAALRNNKDCVRLLMWEGADYNADNADGETSLYLAAARGFADCVLTQLHNAISVPILAIPTNKNDTALHECLRQGETMTECVKELVKHGSDVSFRNTEGDTPMHLALKYHWDKSIVHLLVFKGYNMDFDRKEGSNPGKSPLDIVVYGEPARTENQVERDEELATFFVKMGCSRKLLDILSSELKSKEPASPVLEAILDSMAYLPVLEMVLERQPRFDRYLRRSYASADGGNGVVSDRRRKMEEYLKQAKQVPTLQHLCRCCIRVSLGHEVRKVTSLPLPGHVKSFLLLNQPIPEDVS